MSETFTVYAGPCLHIHTSPTPHLMASLVEYIEQTGNAFSLVRSGVLGQDVYLIPNIQQVQPRRVCAWDRGSDFVPERLDEHDLAREVRRFEQHLDIALSVAHSVVWAIVPYFV
jgi:hypothetical protein